MPADAGSVAAAPPTPPVIESEGHGAERAAVQPAASPAEAERLGNRIAELAARIQAATYEPLVLIREFDAAGAWSGFASCAVWLSWRTGLAPGAAREHVRVAQALERLPQLSDAMRRGQVSYSKVRAVTRVATPETEQALLDVALAGTAAHIERVVRAWRQADRAAERDEDRERQTGRALHTWVDDDGMVVVRGRLTPEAGSVFRRALEAAVAADGRAPRRGAPAGRSERTRWTRRSAWSGAWASGRRTRWDGWPSARWPAGWTGERRATAIRWCCTWTPRRWRGMRRRTVRNTPRAARTRTAGTPRRTPARQAPRSTQRPAAPTAGTFPRERIGRCAGRAAGCPGPHAARRQAVLAEDGGIRVGKETARRIACDAATVTIRHGSDGGVLDVGRRTRTVSPALRRALAARDGQCQFPGCAALRCDAHHIRHWADGGETALSNLVLLCRRHHRAVHEEGFRLSVDTGGAMTFLRPDGRPLPEAPAAPAWDGPALAPVDTRLAAAGIGIDADTAPRWRGEAWTSAGPSACCGARGPARTPRPAFPRERPDRDGRRRRPPQSAPRRGRLPPPTVRMDDGGAGWPVRAPSWVALTSHSAQPGSTVTITLVQGV